MQEVIHVDENWRSRVKPGVVKMFEECLDDPDFLATESFREQCFHIFTHHPTLSDYQIGQFFAKDKASVKFQRHRYQNPAKKQGRPPILSDEQVAAVISYIQDSLTKSHPPTCNDILNFVYDEFRISLIPDTFRHWINRKTEFSTASAAPMEEKRLEVTPEQILSYFAALEHAVDHVPASLVFNLDESGFQRFADARHETVITRKGSPRPLHPVSRSEKRATFLATITASGNFLRPMMIVPRSTIETELLCAGYDSEKVLFATSQEGYITKELFIRYVEHALVPYVRVTRQNINYHGQAVLIMDGCSCHRDARLDEIFDKHGINVIFLPPHSSDQLQPLDVGIFGNQKAAQARIHCHAPMSQQTQQVIRAVSAFQAVAHPYAITAAFRKAGISTCWRDGNVYVEVTIHTAKYVRGIADEGQAPPTAETSESSQCRREATTRIAVSRADWGANQDKYLDEAGYTNYCGEIEDLPILPTTLCEDYVSTIQRDFQGWLLGDISTDEDDEDFVDDQSSDDDTIPCQNGQASTVGDCAVQCPPPPSPRPPAFPGHFAFPQNFATGCSFPYPVFGPLPGYYLHQSIPGIAPPDPTRH